MSKAPDITYIYEVPGQKEPVKQSWPNSFWMYDQTAGGNFRYVQPADQKRVETDVYLIPDAVNAVTGVDAPGTLKGVGPWGYAWSVFTGVAHVAMGLEEWGPGKYEMVANRPFRIKEDEKQISALKDALNAQDGEIHELKLQLYKCLGEGKCGGCGGCGGRTPSGPGSSMGSASYNVRLEMDDNLTRILDGINDPTVRRDVVRYVTDYAERIVAVGETSNMVQGATKTVQDGVGSVERIVNSPTRPRP